MADTADLHVPFAFRPTDQAMIGLLERKVNGTPIPATYPILERNLYSAAPWDVLKEDDPWEDSDFPNKKIVIVFSKLTFKSENTKNRVVRTAGGGTWEGKAVAQKIKNSRGQVTGQKRSFTFKPQKGFDGKGRWIMHEYSLVARENGNSDHVICRISKEPPKDESQETGQDQVLSTEDSTVSADSVNTATRRKRKSPIDNSDPEHQQQSKERNTTEERVNQYTAPYFPVPNQGSENQENPLAYLRIPYSTDPNMYKLDLNQEHEAQRVQEDDYQQIIPYSSQPLPCLVIHPILTIPLQSFATPPWENSDTTNVEETGKNPKS